MAQTRILEIKDTLSLRNLPGNAASPWSPDKMMGYKDLKGRMEHVPFTEEIPPYISYTTTCGRFTTKYLPCGMPGVCLHCSNEINGVNFFHFHIVFS
ncbi:naphthoate synthase [Robiginitalea biformata HTCC2501]|uniref:Naphthoate synthase n=1 Tax=Robiginitalea biformata (strain ATCC BAA-864 / DSM 15991 / KCTC 12146 / HTCC2501) TaxID=313596 RepID=A4CL93_ROBBH|nr:naphthoate synthase [Robiginitalea biformata HTCC2501]